MNPPRALVVDDDPSWAALLVEILADSGLEVDQAGSLDAALDLLRAQPHRLAVVDLSLRADDPHNQDGLRVLEAARRMDPGCAAVLLTGFATVEVAVRALSEFGALTCLRKETFQRGALRSLAAQALARPPADAPGQKRAEPAPGPAAESEAGGLALVVDDDAGWRSILGELLEDAGFQARLCGGYGEALACLRRDNYQLAVVDLALAGDAQPGAAPHGFRLLDAARERGIPAIIVSGSSAPEQIERAYQPGGAAAYLEKQAFDRRSFVRLAQEIRETTRQAGPLAALTEREREVLALLADGLPNREIAARLTISENTVKRHVKAVFAKLGVHTRAAAGKIGVRGQG